MLAKHISKCREFVAGDGCHLREVLLPPRDRTGEKFSLAHARIKPGGRSAKHKLKSSETYVVLEGKGVAHVGGRRAAVKKGSVVFVPRNTVQWVENKGKKSLVFLCIVSPAWKKEDETVLE
ncbi:MAG: cupin domain-containing protein [Candidatus Micrarchaeia archaeon]|jgi:mannose-6-phosphate isomerase-like protein (cupin superfamily)